MLLMPIYTFRKLLRKVRLSSIFSVYLALIFSLILSLIFIFEFSVNKEDNDNGASLILKNDNLQKEFIDKKGIHVIVGRYVEQNLKSNENYNNLAKNILNTNNYNPIPGFGDNGQPVYMNEFEKNKADLLFFINKFNLVASDKISVNRTLPDLRRNSCKKIIYKTTLPQTSIIIVFHNEAWSTLLRTVHSIINRSPQKLLKQIILVDDASERSFLKKELVNYMNKLSIESKIEILVLESTKRIGLIKARLLGTKHATGNVLTFLDAHVEVTTGWLIPLLEHVREYPESIICPIIDIINEQTFAYSKSFDLHWGGINWNLHFRWFAMGEQQYKHNREYNFGYIVDKLRKNFIEMSTYSKQDIVKPFKSPIMAGGLFSINRDYFYKIGLYDEEMDIWGGENIELSLRTWLCGGRIEIHPCSHVGHLFRKSSPYSFPRKGGVSLVLYQNLARIVEVWMEKEYKFFFYLLIPILRKTVFNGPLLENKLEFAIKSVNLPKILSIINNSTYIKNKLKNIEKRIELKNELKCKNFSHFLNDVWPQNFFPTKQRFFGQIKNRFMNACFQTPNNDLGSYFGRLQLNKCTNNFDKKQLFVYDKIGWIMTDESLCLDVNQVVQNGKTNVVLIACSEQERQKWIIELNLKIIKHFSSGLCLDLHNNLNYLTLKNCDYSQKQVFDFVFVEWWNVLNQLD